jgi:hypothetical protein
MSARHFLKPSSESVVFRFDYFIFFISRVFLIKTVTRTTVVFDFKGNIALSGQAFFPFDFPDYENTVLA